MLRPADTSEPRPTLYLLSGAGGGIDTATWKLRTDAPEFLSDKNINVVQIMASPATEPAQTRGGLRRVKSGSR
ncbi:Uncharacterised protein [Nocardia otitidiscaviarum]|uniref:Uncharacterized protein n=1 Tax=Nocardia otitidiscaviarum TaxID=1823 RepID=A0A378YAT3_9NOCA|nr:Uncharacterised protein [Nocardia otitidiscaviarum]